MKQMRTRVVAAVIAANLLFSPFGINGDTSKWTGENFSQSRDLIDAFMKGRNYAVEIDQHGAIKHLIDAGASGSGQVPRQSVASSTVTTPAESPTDVVASVAMPINYQGQTAVDFLAGDLPAVARQHALTPDKLKELLLSDMSLRVDSNKRLFFTDDTVADHHQPDQPAAAEEVADEAAANNLQLPIGMTPATVNAFKLHSKPKASKTLYLDFNGHTATNSFWSSSALVAPAFDLDGNPNNFNTNELSNIISIWNRVAEDFIPFDVDVTTEAPPADALLRSSQADATYGVRVVITKTGTIRCNCAGIAYVGVVAAVNGEAFQPAWVFQQSLANNEKYIAEAAAHEAGHNLGLFHDGQKTGATVNYYYEGHGSGATSWAPIMGVGYYKSVTQWSNGQYPAANNQQDDLAVLAANGFNLRADDAGNTIATAKRLTSASATGVIEEADDVDMYKLDTLGGLLELDASPAAAGANLDIKLVLFQADGTMLAQSAPDPGLSASISTIVPAGAYFLSVSGASHAATGSDFGYPAYGNLGQYRITGNFAVADIAATPTAVLSASKVTGPAALTVNFSASQSISRDGIIEYRWAFGDGTYSSSPTPVHTYTKAGTYNATLTVIDQTQTADTASVQIKAAPPPPVRLFASSVKLNLIKSKNVRAKAAITVVDAKKRPIPNAIVRGFWSGSFSGAATGKTGANGIAVQTARPIPNTRGGAANFTLTAIESKGHVFKPGPNGKKIVTLSW